MSAHLFAYGTLIVPEIMKIVSGEDLLSFPATITGYQRLNVRDEVYPAVIAEPNGHVGGFVYPNLSDTFIDRLDFFEGELYEKHNVVAKQDRGEEIFAFVYVFPPSQRQLLLENPWDYHEFRTLHLEDYIKRATNIMSEYIPASERS